MINRTSALKLILLCSVLSFNHTPAIAQIIPDNTLGAESSRVLPNGAIDKIDGGALRDKNLFHSFTEFNINNGQRVYFNNPSGIENILTRVTGGNASNILGTLGVDGAANLFLINPNGIVFGENARLDLGGSFVGTTANGLQFGEQGDFSATNPQAPGLLTVNPNALFFNQINQLSDKGNITNLARQRGLNGQTNVTGGPVGLQVPDGKTLALVGGNVLLDDGNLTTFGGKIEVGSVAGTGTVNLDSTKDGFIFNYDAVDDFGEIRLENTAVVDVSAGGGGSITINASNLELKESILLAGIRQGFGTPEAQAGDITINAVSKVLLDNQSYISNDVKFGGVGKAGDVSISTGSLEVFNGAQIGAATFGQGDAGNVTINATNLVKFDGEDNDGFASGAFSTVESDAVGKAGGISISTSSLELTNGARLSSSTFGVGNAGSVEITATDVIKFDGEGEYNFSGAFSRVETGAEGKAGGVSISTNSLEVLNGAAVSASTWGEGDAGSVEITATDLVKFDGIGEINTSGAYSPVVSGAEGNAGGIFISTGSLEVVNGARLSASTNGQGNAGNIFVRANGAVSLSNSNIFSNVEAGAEGDGGEIDINAKSLSLINGSQIQTIIRGGSETVAGGKGEAGNININVGGELALFGIDNDNFASGIFSIVQSGTEGNGGNIDITAGEISMNDGATIQSSTFGTGNAGNIQVQTSDLITGDLILENDALIAADTFSADGIGGNIKIEVGKLIANNGGQISTGSGEQFQEGNFGRGGDLVVTAFDSIELDGNGVGNTYRTGFFAETSSRNRAGDLTVNTNKLIVQNGAGISSGASGSGSLGGDGGNLVINATESIDLIGTSSNYRSALVTQANGLGNAGDMKITTSRLNVTDEAVISTLVTSGERTTNQFTIGNGGNIDITVDSMEVANGSRIIAATFGLGFAGNINIQASEYISFDGSSENFNSGVSSSVGESGIGVGGDIRINTREFSLSNGAEVVASVDDGGWGEAGNIQINADKGVTLNNRAKLFAESASGNGGNIKLELGELLLLRNSSQVSTTAGTAQAGGDGGNIDINSPFIVALPNENSDITANAFEGRGGNVDIITQGIFGIQPRSQTTLQSDITASSETGIQGEISITDPEINPSQGLIELPTGLVDRSNQIAQICPRGVNAQQLSEFYITGKGSLPPSPLDMLTGTVESSRLASLDGESVRGGRGGRGGRIYQESQEIVEAQGFMKAENGEIYLVAQAPSAALSATISKSACVEAAQK